jgi:hypothetical protein
VCTKSVFFKFNFFVGVGGSWLLTSPPPLRVYYWLRFMFMVTITDHLEEVAVNGSQWYCSAHRPRIAHVLMEIVGTEWIVKRSFLSALV